MTKMTTTTEDDIIKKRLLIEGDSGIDDRLINKLVKNFVKWSNKEKTETTETGTGTERDGEGEVVSKSQFEEKSLYEQIQASLGHAEFGLLKNQFVLDMNQVEQANYDVLYKKINSEISRASQKIVVAKKDLEEARKIRKNRQEYDMIARKILLLPSRGQQAAKIKALEDKVEHLKRSEHEHDRKIEQRRKQFGCVLQSLSTMKNLIENDMKSDDHLDSYNNNNNNNNNNYNASSGSSSKTSSSEARKLASAAAAALENMDEDSVSSSAPSSVRGKHQNDVEMEGEY
jgi:THO complex subunit 7